MSILLRADGTATFEFPHLLRPARPPPVRHDLPRALLVLLACDVRRDPERARARRLRRRGASDARRIASRVRAARRRVRTRRRAVVGEILGTRAAGGAAPSGALRASSPRTSRSPSARFSTCSSGSDGTASRSSATERRARATRCSTTAGSVPISWTTQSTAIRTGTGYFTPGTHIPIYPPERIAETRPDFIVVLPWNLIDEISQQLEYVRDWGARLIVPIPYATVLE